MAQSQVAPAQIPQSEIDSILVKEGIAPLQLATATIFKTYQCTEITPDDVKREYGSAEFNFSVLETNFATHCKDYNDLISEKASVAIEFAIKVIFESGPQLRTEKKSKGDKVVKFNFYFILKSVVIDS
ncbi:unnamed protein product, partial [Brenthis ino]